MRAPLLVVLLSLTAAAQSAPRFLRFTSRMEPGRNTRGLLANSLAFFEAFPSNGAGTFGACSTTAPTGARGEALTFTRGSTATCTKTATGGLVTTGIANGDLVVMASNQPRVGYDSGGKLKLLVESSRTNSVLRSEEFDNAVWTKAGTLVAAPTVTANYATAPDGTLTADRVQFAACPVGAASVVYQNTGTALATSSVYAKGTSGSGAISICQYSNAANACTPCAFNSSTWTRCVHAAPDGLATYITIGCQNDTANYPNGSNTGAADVLLWGAQHEAGSYATSYVPTTSATVTRSAETATFPVAASGYLSLAASFELVGNGNGNLLTTNTGSGIVSNGATSASTYVDSSSKATRTASLLGAHRIYGYWNATQSASGVDGVESTGTTAPASAFTTLGLLSPTGGLYSVGGVGLIGEICLDPNPTRCR